MSSPDSQHPLMLEQYDLQNQEISVLKYAGGGNAGYVFKFKFDNPQLNPSRLRGLRRKLLYDNFFIECRANGSLIAQQLNGKLTPFCYGWTLVSPEVELYVAKKYNVQSFLWDRPPDATNERVQGILFEWVSGSKMLSQIHLTLSIANQTRDTLKELHRASVAHGDIRAANILINKKGRVYLIDLDSASILSPEMSSPEDSQSQTKLKEAQDKYLQDLEIGFALLSQLPINENDVCMADLSLLGQSSSSLEEILIEYASMKRHWRPPVPSFWHKPI